MPNPRTLPSIDASQPWYEFKAQAADDATIAELHIFGVIGNSWWGDSVSGKEVADLLAALSDDVTTIRVFVNSPGGNVYDGQHIFNALRRQREDHGRALEVHIDGMALSAATLVASAGGPNIAGASGFIRMPANAIYMVHNPYFLTVGNAAQLREDANLLERIGKGIIATYKWCSSLAADALQALMDDETWMDAAEALANGFITEVVEPVEAEAAFDPSQIFDIPEEYRDRVMALMQPNAEADGESDSGDDESEGDGADDDSESEGDADSSDDATDEGGDEGGDDDGEESADDSDEPIEAADVVRMCREGDCMQLAETLIESNANRGEVAARVEHASRINELCAAAEMPELAEGYIANEATEDSVREQLASIAARLDDSTEINGNIDPDARSRPKGQTVSDIYAERNKAHFAAQRQES